MKTSLQSKMTARQTGNGGKVVVVWGGGGVLVING